MSSLQPPVLSRKRPMHNGTTNACRSPQPPSTTHTLHPILLLPRLPRHIKSHPIPIRSLHNNNKRLRLWTLFCLHPIIIRVNNGVEPSFVGRDPGGGGGEGGGYYWG